MVTPIFELVAPAGTVTVTCVSEFTVKLVATTLLNVIFDVCVRLTPVTTTDVPGGPLVGLKLVICGFTWNCLLLVRVPLGVVTVMKPVVAPLGTSRSDKYL